MDPLSVTVSIIAILQLSCKVLGYMHDVKDAPNDRARCGIEASNLNVLLASLILRLEEGSFDEPCYSAVQALGAKSGPLDQFKRALEQLQAKMTDGGRLKKLTSGLMWRFSKEEITGILARMERLKTLVQIAKLSQAIKKLADMTYSNTEAAKSGLDAIRQHQDHAVHEQLMGWISTTDFPAQQSDLIACRQEGTGQWFLDAPEFTRWLHGPNVTLCCPGSPGAGKTMITAIVIDHLLQAVGSGGDIGVAYVYFNYKAQVNQNASSLLAAILKQLVQSRPSLAEPIEHLHMQHADRGTKPSLEEIFGALQTVLANHSIVYIAIDALDECPNRDGTRRQFLAKLRDLQGKNRIDLRLVVTSRFIPDILADFSAALTLEVRASDEDVKRFVAGQTDRLPGCIRRDKILQGMVQDKIVQAVDGMFVLARLHIDSLLDKRTRKIVQRTLESLSRGFEALNKAYDDAIERIKGQRPGDSALATNVLSWIIHARRPLTTEELCHALAVLPDDEELDLDNLHDVEDIVSVCAGLVTVDEESNIVRLVHYTAQEYFEQIQEEWNLGADLKIASTCLTYLSFHVFRDGNCSTEKDFKSRLVHNPFLDYAARHWGSHALTVQEEVRELACSFLQRSNSVCCAMQVASIPANAYHNYLSNEQCNYIHFFPNTAIGLHLTAQFGLLCLSEELLSRSERDVIGSIESKTDYGATPLELAAEHGHGAVVNLLMDKIAEVNVQGGDFAGALYKASVKGHVAVVKLLLEKSPDANMQGEAYSNALDAAAGEGHKQTVILLLNHGVEVNAGKACDNALCAASERGHEEIVKLLLDKAADVNAPTGPYGNALYMSSLCGHEQIVKLLLDKGADVNARGGEKGNALQAASAGGYLQIVKLLLNRGAEVNARDGLYGYSVDAASHWGHEQVLKLLLDNGAEVTPLSQYNGNAIQAASLYGYEQIVKLLLEKGADVNWKDEEYGNALHAASAGGHEQIVKLLLEKGAKVNMPGGPYGNALNAASAGGHQQIVKLLLDDGAEINARAHNHGNALEAASERGHEKIVKLLLEKGAKVDMEGGDYGNALNAASAGGHEQIVRLLLDSGAKVNAQVRDHGNALQAASYWRHEKIVKLLLDKGADISWKDGKYGNALHAASGGGHEQTVKLLLEKGATVDIEGGYCGNALNAAAFAGHKQIVKLLLDSGAKYDSQVRVHGNALRAVSYEGHEKIVKLLLDKGADVNAQRESKGCIPIAASARSHDLIGKVLFDEGLEGNAQGARYCNALLAASAEGHEQIVKPLLEKSAEVNSTGFHYSNALWAASIRGHEQIVKLLLDKGVRW
ncbi:hypothetical protein MMC07_006786 [Pseudocyphellaria aurata]|nr:hypothetical protein [Pseudocyphellaria aurata]